MNFHFKTLVSLAEILAVPVDISYKTKKYFTLVGGNWGKIAGAAWDWETKIRPRLNRVVKGFIFAETKLNSKEISVDDKCRWILSGSILTQRGTRKALSSMIKSSLAMKYIFGKVARHSMFPKVP